MLLRAARPFALPKLGRSLPPLTTPTMSAYAAVSTQPTSKGAPNPKQTYHTVTALKRWRCNPEDKDLPPVSDIKAIHVYDFDNTCTPAHLISYLTFPLILL